MRRITPFRLPTLVFGGAIASALTFGTSSAVATPQKDPVEPYYCGWTLSWDDCERCCGKYQSSWEQPPECWCGPDTKS
jgi:hypothetical protein